MLPTARCLVPFTKKLNFPSTTLIRLYKLLKNNANKNWQTTTSSRDALVCQLRVNTWWRMTGSNRRPPACKAGALPAELIPRELNSVVGLAGFEPATPALSRRCSNQLSYRPTRSSRVLLSSDAYLRGQLGRLTLFVFTLAVVTTADKCGRFNLSACGSCSC